MLNRKLILAESIIMPLHRTGDFVLQFIHPWARRPLRFLIILLFQILLDLLGCLKKMGGDTGSLTVKQWKRRFDSISFWNMESIMDTCMGQNWTQFVMSFVRGKCVS
jgi:hypothetical protein